MKIINKTKWQTAQLRAFIVRIAEAELEPKNRKRLKVTIVPARQQTCCSGWWPAYSRSIQINMPTRAMSDKIKIDFCSVVAHEMHHVETQSYGRSWEINNRRSIPYGRPKTEAGLASQRELYAWALGLPIEAMPPAAKPAALELASTKREHIAGKIIEWERRAKRCKTALAKYRRRLGYYDRRIAACPKS